MLKNIKHLKPLRESEERRLLQLFEIFEKTTLELKNLARESKIRNSTKSDFIEKKLCAERRRKWFGMIFGKDINIDKKDILYDGNCSDEDANNVTDDIMNKASKALDAFDNSISPEQRSKLGPLQFPGSTLQIFSIWFLCKDSIPLGGCCRKRIQVLIHL